ncbi:MAG: virulence factor family protein [Proteobacteria bacterium]|nr:virulence factor family protein [Pseudomonadota bacterium]
MPNLGSPRFLAIGTAFVSAVILSVYAFTPHAGTKIVSQKRFGDVPVLWPGKEPRAFVVLIADPDGGSRSYKSIADQLVNRGAAVAILSRAVVRSILSTAGQAGQCIRLFGDIEDLVRLSERDLKMPAWESPVFFGLGRAATVAYLALAQGPPNSVSGVVSVGFSPDLASSAPFCSGAPLVGSKDGHFEYGPTALNGQWITFAKSTDDPTLKPFVGATPGAKLEVGSVNDHATLEKAITSVFQLGIAAKASLSDLPLTELPAATPTGLAIFISGDGGWRDIDKQIGETLSERGMSVVGVDALRYFWSKKDPQTIASDIGRIARHYGSAWHVGDIALVGYSFGAATIPMVWAKLDPDLQKKIKLIVMLAPERVGRFEMSMSGWLGIRSAEDISLRPFLAELPKDKVVCIYSAEEKTDGTTGCTLPELSGAALIERTGGHHFGGAYKALAQLILDRWAVIEAKR